MKDRPAFRPRSTTWDELMRRTFGYVFMACLECGGRLRLIAMIEQPEVIKKILPEFDESTDSTPADF